MRIENDVKLDFSDVLFRPKKDRHSQVEKKCHLKEVTSLNIASTDTKVFQLWLQTWMVLDPLKWHSRFKIISSLQP